jgi:hypothetical protein
VWAATPLDWHHRSAWRSQQGQLLTCAGSSRSPRATSTRRRSSALLSLVGARCVRLQQQKRVTRSRVPPSANIMSDWTTSGSSGAPPCAAAVPPRMRGQRAARSAAAAGHRVLPRGRASLRAYHGITRWPAAIAYGCSCRALLQPRRAPICAQRGERDADVSTLLHRSIAARCLLARPTRILSCRLATA